MTTRAPAVLTREFLQGATQKVVFQPATLEEAEYIGDQLQRLGYRYYQDEYPKQLAMTLKGSMYLDTDKTIMVSDAKAEGIAATADGFDNFYISPFDAAAARIKPAELMQGVFAFFPRSTTEARGLLSALKEAGATRDGDEGTFKLAGRAVYQGVILRDGHIGFGASPEDLREARITSASDLGIGAPVIMSPEQATLIAVFNEVTARLEKMNARLERIEDEIMPKKIEKSRTALPKP
ncbi:MAG: hypothetical protein PSY14_10820 [bacterium]|nr:hypothetical protein [bacterium]